MRLPSPTASLLFVGLGLSLAACNKSTGGTPEGECAGPEDCGAGLQCIDAQCIEVQCTTSADCPFEAYCDNGNYTCVDGCQDDTDCLAGDSCDDTARACVSAQCDDTQLDCEVGQLCDAGTGDCVDDSRPHCGTCDATRGGGNQCPGGECVAFAGQSCNTAADCDPGQACDTFTGSGKLCHSDFCLMSCNDAVDNACPAGFSCQQIYSTSTATYCVADCEFLSGNGYL